MEQYEGLEEQTEIGHQGTKLGTRSVVDRSRRKARQCNELIIISGLVLFLNFDHLI